MPDLLSIGGNSVKTNQSALAVVGNNIANANTDGYVRQELDVRENLPTRAGTVYLGSGALATGVKRAYDALVESSLRSSFSDLRSQEPIIDLTTRVVDILGDENASLTPALDDFFSSFRDLGLDPSSQLRRDMVLSESKGLASRFNEIGAQLQSIDMDSQETLNYRVTEFNSIVEQLYTLNTKLGRQSKLEAQPADLLNTRDKLLHDLSGLMKIKVIEEQNGAISVTVGDESSGLTLLNKNRSTQIKVDYQLGSIPRRVDLILDPYGNPQNLNGISGGEIGGHIIFRESVLKTAYEQVDVLAQKIATSVNETLTQGMDLYGLSGSALFDIPPTVIADKSFAKSNISVSTAITSPENLIKNDLEAMFDKTNQRWLVTDLGTKQTFVTNSVNAFSINGVSVSISGQPMDGDIFTVTIQDSQASNIRVVIDDSKKLAAAELFGLTLGSQNTGGAKGRVAMLNPASGVTTNSIQDILVNNLHESSAKTIQASVLTPSFTIPTGTTDLDLSVMRSNGSNAEMQVFTREGVHLFGTGGISQNNLNAMLIANNGFESTANYSSSYLNGNANYLGHQWSLGVSGKSLVDLSGDTGILKKEASIIGESLPTTQNTTGAIKTLIAKDALSLNGVKLNALQLGAGATLSVSNVVNWLNTNISQNSLGLTASAENIISIPQNEINLTSNSLTINGTNITISAPMADLSVLVNAINSSAATTGVFAGIDPNQQLTLRNKNGSESNTITFGGGTGVLSKTGAIPAQIKIEANRAGSDLSDKTVSLTRNATSTSADLGILGFTETLSLKGALDEDLIIFTQGATSESLDYYTGYKNSSINFLHQRDDITDVKFTSATTYELVDRATDTILSTRNWSYGQSINYGAISLTIEGQPNSGDIFSIDGNQAGLASNENALRIADIEDSRVFGTGQTAKESYLSILTDAGNASRRSSVSQEALDVVYQQVVEAKDAKAGVNLDEEAASLLRFQQAYQASARVMQMAGQLFDSLLRIQ
ncbi:MAG: flagellar hook-associated protein FlgK [Gammaproteobacteria bacterium]|nr:flagellar hook-associated protein FlgK [Gammaproteobacteria bacterium]OUV67420.1 MAG: flagellar hook-associated protein FlgK [Gammaproteobacteria bacterium TMED133]